jgi:hypothetical protein
VPSLQTTGPLDVLCADETAGAASSTAANTALKLRPLSLVFVRSIAATPFRATAQVSGAQNTPIAARGGTRPGRSTLGLKLNEDSSR